MTSLIIVDAQGPDRQKLAGTLQAGLPDLSIAEAGSLDELVRVLSSGLRSDLILVELTQSVSAMVSRLVRVRMIHPVARFALIAAQPGRRDVMDCIAAGLAGYLAKTQPAEEIVQGVAQMLDGKVYVPPSLGRAPVGVADRPEIRRSILAQTVGGTAGPDLGRLTLRQRDVLKLLVLGLSNKEIARRLSIAEPTAKIHVAALMRTLGARNRSEAVGMAKGLPDGELIA